MALWVDPNVETVSPDVQMDLDAITALRESAAIELKEKGNEYVKMGKKHYSDAVDCYTRAIQQKSMNDVDTAILYANRAQVHLLLGNYRRCLNDAREALKLNKSNVKACFRGAKAALALELFQDAAELCSMGLEHDTSNTELAKLKVVIDKKMSELEEEKRNKAIILANAELLASTLINRGIKMGKPAYKEHTGGQKPWLDDSKLLHWPVLFLYPEVMSSDLVQDVCEVDTFSYHLDTIFGKNAEPLSWDQRNEYTRENIQLFYKACVEPCLSKDQLISFLLEGSNYSDGKDTEDLDLGDNQTGMTPKWIQVSERSTLHDVLAKKNHVIPGVPVFYVLSKASSFYEEFLSGRWSGP